MSQNNGPRKNPNKPASNPALSINEKFFAQQKQLDFDRFEHSLVDYLLKKFGMSRWRGELLQLRRTRIDDSLLQLQDFCYTFTDFPMYLGSRVIPHIAKKNPFSRFFLGFETTQLVQKYDEFLDSMSDEGRPLGLVFRWPNVPHGMLLHNGVIDHAEDGAKLVWCRESDQLTLQPFSLFVRSVQTWRPTEG